MPPSTTQRLQAAVHGPPLLSHDTSTATVSLLLSVLLPLLQGFLASDRKSALELFDKAEEFFKQCKEHVSCCTRTRHIAATQR